MIIWRLSNAQHARSFGGGYGLLYDGRWNTAGHAITYCATSPSLCVLEKLVHIDDPALMPALVMVRYDVPDSFAYESIMLDDMPPSWRLQEGWTQKRGDAWHEAADTPLLRVPSAVVPIPGSPGHNVLINHLHPASETIANMAADPFILDTRLF